MTGGTSRLKQGAIATKDRHNGEVYTTFIGRHLLCATIYAVSSAVMILAALCYQLPEATPLVAAESSEAADPAERKEEESTDGAEGKDEETGDESKRHAEEKQHTDGSKEEEVRQTEPDEP